jgi:hypothetical protein
MKTLFAIVTLLVAPNICQAQIEKPQILIDSHYVASTGIKIIVGQSESLQNAFNVAKPGDEITITAGVTKTGNFTLPNFAGNGWVNVISSNLSNLPVEGIRVSPTNSTAMPKIITPNAAPAITTVAGAHHFRFVGIEFGIAPGVVANFGIVVFGDGSAAQNNLNLIPHDLILDRCYVHGNNTGDVSRGVTLNSASTAIVDSYISNCHIIGQDSQAICGWNGPGPFKIVNSYLEGAGENFMLGGADPHVANMVPSDIEFRRNYCTKPLNWKQNDPSFAGQKWSIKNLFELKNARRVLVDGNVFENCWLDAQVGYAVQFTVRNQENIAPWSIVSDVTFANNIVRHSSAGINILGRDDINPSQQLTRMLIANNVFDDIGAVRWGGNGRFLQITDTSNVKVDHNTVFHTYNVITAYGLSNANFIYTNNISAHNDYGIMGDNSSYGNISIAKYFPGSIIAKNVLAGGVERLYPAGNFFPANLDAVGFTDRSGGNYRLASTSIYKKVGTDGLDLGADIDAIQTAMSGAAIPPTPPPSPGTIFNMTLPVGGSIEMTVRDSNGVVIGIVKVKPPQ